MLVLDAASELPIARAGSTLERVVLAGPAEVSDDRSTKKFLDQVGRPVSDLPASSTVREVMNEFVFMAEPTISTGRSDPHDLVRLSVWLTNTNVGPSPRPC